MSENKEFKIPLKAKGDHYKQVIWLDSETIAYLFLLRRDNPILTNLATNELVSLIVKVALKDKELASVVAKKLIDYYKEIAMYR